MKVEIKYKLMLFGFAVLWTMAASSFMKYIEYSFVRKYNNQLMLPSELMKQVIGLNRFDVILCTAPIVLLFALIGFYAVNIIKLTNIKIKNLVNYNTSVFIFFNLVVLFFLYGSKSQNIVVFSYWFISSTIIIILCLRILRIKKII